MSKETITSLDYILSLIDETWTVISNSQEQIDDDEESVYIPEDIPLKEFQKPDTPETRIQALRQLDMLISIMTDPSLNYGFQWSKSGIQSIIKHTKEMKTALLTDALTKTKEDMRYGNQTFSSIERKDLCDTYDYLIERIRNITTHRTL